MLLWMSRLVGETQTVTVEEGQLLSWRDSEQDEACLLEKGFHDLHRSLLHEDNKVTQSFTNSPTP